MATARSLADGHIKLAILTTKPANPALPTSTELSAGIAAECNILSSDFVFGATDSDKIAEKALCTINTANAIGASNSSRMYPMAKMPETAPTNVTIANETKKGTRRLLCWRRSGTAAPTSAKTSGASARVVRAWR